MPAACVRRAEGNAHLFINLDMYKPYSRRAFSFRKARYGVPRVADRIRLTKSLRESGFSR